VDACPSHARLVELLSEEPEADVPAPLQEHLGRCGRCQESLLQLAGDVAFDRWRHLFSRKPGASPGPSDSFLQRVKQALPVSGPVAGPADRTAWPSIPGYDIVEEVGRGGLAIVYKARQRSLNRFVAVKVLRANLAPDDWRRTMRVRELVAHLHHPHIIRFHDGLQFGDRYAIVLEYLEGGSLRQHLDGTPWPPHRTAILLRTLAETVQVIHAQGILHRDLKPSNILLTANNTPKIADFGLARSVGEHDPITRYGHIVGSTPYMAAEQAAGLTDLGPGVDIHALGVILYQLLTGHPPFHGATRLDTLEQVVYDEPVPPSRSHPGVPRDLEAICLRCLEKEVIRRYPSAQELADDLGRFLRGEPVRARPVAWWKRLGKWVQRRPAVAALLAAQVVTLLIASWALVAANDGRRQQLQVETALEAAEADLYQTRIELARQAFAAHDMIAAEAHLAKCVPLPGRQDRRGPEWYDLWRRCHEPPENK
jgi:hypothetical protein